MGVRDDNNRFRFSGNKRVIDDIRSWDASLTDAIALRNVLAPSMDVQDFLDRITEVPIDERSESLEMSRTTTRTTRSAASSTRRCRSAWRPQSGQRQRLLRRHEGAASGEKTIKCGICSPRRSRSPRRRRASTPESPRPRAMISRRTDAPAHALRWASVLRRRPRRAVKRAAQRRPPPEHGQAPIPTGRRMARAASVADADGPAGRAARRGDGASRAARSPPRRAPRRRRRPGATLRRPSSPRAGPAPGRPVDDASVGWSTTRWRTARRGRRGPCPRRPSARSVRALHPDAARAGVEKRARAHGRPSALNAADDDGRGARGARAARRRGARPCGPRRGGRHASGPARFER